MDALTFEKLREVEARFALVETSMTDPAIASDPAAYQKLAREAKEMSPIVSRYRSYKDVLAELAKVEEMARSESDPDLREMAHEEARTRRRFRTCFRFFDRFFNFFLVRLDLSFAMGLVLASFQLLS